MDTNNQQNKDNFDEEILANWEIPEYESYPRSKRWYLVAFLAFFGLLIYCLYTANFLFAVILVFIALIQYLNEKSSVNQLLFTITPDGIYVGDKFHPYKTIDNFYIIYEPPEIKKLFFIFKNPLKPRLSIPLLEENPVIIREALKRYLDEDLEKEYEPLTEKLSRMLKL